MSTQEWKRIFSEAAELGVLHLHLSGGEPCSRRDLAELTAHAAEVGLYTNLITSGVGLTRELFDRLVAAGLDHLQLSIQGVDAAQADWIGGYKGGYAKKREVAAWVTAEGLPLTVNAVIHRGNVEDAPRMVDLAVELGARRVEIAHTQYYGWALKNRAHLMPTREQTDRAYAAVEARREHYRGTVVIDHVAPDYHAKFPKACMSGWGRQTLNVSPERQGAAVPFRRDHPRPRILERARKAACRNLGEFAGVPGVSRLRVDAGALPLVRAQGDRFRRLPLPGDGAARRRRRHATRSARNRRIMAWWARSPRATAPARSKALRRGAMRESRLCELRCRAFEGFLRLSPTPCRPSNARCRPMAK